jgi:hypothetical protein
MSGTEAKTQPKKTIPPKRKSYMAVIGFVLAFTGFVSCGLFTVPALALCAIGVRHKRHRKLAWTGLVICFCTLILWILTITSPGSVPYPINLLKYRLVCESYFWLNYDKEHIMEAQCGRPLLFVGSVGSIHFKVDQKNHYDPNQVISFAEKNGWIYGGKFHLTNEDFSKFLSDWEKLADENFDLYRTIHEITGYVRSPLLWIKDNCTVFAFNTGQGNGLPSYVMINDNNNEIAVYANHGVYPDGVSEFRLPPLFEKAE